MPGVRLLFMQSSGGLTDAHAFRGKDAILSGPAGGIVGMARTAQAAGFDRVIGFDMGGTSTDVSHFAGEFERAVRDPGRRGADAGTDDEHPHGRRGRRLDPAFRRRAVPRRAAESPGADPGPACYRRGGPLTVTDANVMLGKIQPAYFPRVFGASAPTSRSTRDRASRPPVRRRSAAEPRPARDRRRRAGARGGGREVQRASRSETRWRTRSRRSRSSAATTSPGTRWRCFGGAGRPARLRRRRRAGHRPRCFVHPLAGVLSAYGMGLADQTAMREAVGRGAAGRRPLPELDRVADALAADASAALVKAGAAPEGARQVRRAHLRYEGTDTALPVPFGPLRRDAGRLRAVVPAALRLPHARQGDHRRGRVGRAAAPSAPVDVPELADAAAARRAAVGAGAGGWGRRIRFAVFAVAGGRGRALARAAGPEPRRAGGRPGRDRGGLRDHRGRAGLAGGADRAG